jgi:hypothetical protein
MKLSQSPFGVEWALNPMNDALIRTGEDTQRYSQRRGHVMLGAELK